MQKLDPLSMFLSAFSISSVGGLAALLRSQRQLTFRAVVSTSLYSGLTGLVIALLSHNYFGVDNPYFLLGVCGLAGIGGTTVIDFVLQTIRNGGVDIRFSPKRDNDGADEDETRE
jgi:hypothetical protein